jgi:translation initiation factor IF-2
MMGGISIHEFSAQTKIRMEDIRERLMALGEQSLARAVGKNPETMIDVDVAELLALEMGMEIERVAEKGAISSIDQEVMRESLKTKIDQEHLLKRAPVVSVMGHVDHGKTTLLDALRSKTSARAVAGTEAGGITQKLSAFTVVPDGREEEIVFLDTPGHSAFSVMRGQGALATDIVVLVVALDDGVQPQTLEALRCAKSAKCSIVLALNKVDKFHSESEKTKQRRKILLELSNHDLLTEDYGGDVQVVEVSGKSGAGLEQLVESICLQAEVLELKANHSGLAEAVVLESKFEKGRGIIAEVLVRWGALKVGDPIVVGTVMAKIRGLIDENGKQQKVAHPSKLVRVLGFKEIPDSGVELLSVESETQAKSIIDRRRKLLERKAALLEKKAEKKAAKIDRIRGRLGRKRKIIEQRAEEARVAALSPEEAAAEAALDEDEELPMVGVMLRADGSGSLEALRQIVETIADKVAEFVDLRVAEAQIGEIRASDLEKCLGIGETVILAFNVSMSDLSLRSKFKQADIPIFQDDVIYGLEDSLVDKLEEILPKIRTVTKEVSDHPTPLAHCPAHRSPIFLSFSRARRRC